MQALRDSVLEKWMKWWQMASHLPSHTRHSRVQADEHHVLQFLRLNGQTSSPLTHADRAVHGRMKWNWASGWSF